MTDAILARMQEHTDLERLRAAFAELSERGFGADFDLTWRAFTKQDAAAEKPRYLLKALVLSLPIENVRHRHVAIRNSLRRIDPFKQDDVFGFRKRKWTQQHRVDGVEDRAIGADTQRECDDSDSKKTGPLDQVTNSIAYVLDRKSVV